MNAAFQNINTKLRKKQMKKDKAIENLQKELVDARK